MTWWIHAANKESKSLVIHKTRQKPYLERKLSNHLSSLLFHSKLPLFYSKLAFFFNWNCRALLFHFFKTVKFATFSLKTIKSATFIQNCLVYHYFNWHCRARYFYLFSIVMGFSIRNRQTCHSHSIQPETIKLATFYSKLSSSLLFSI